MTMGFLSDAKNDLYIDARGNLAIGTGMKAVLQACASAAKAMRGEMILAINDGIPNFQLIWVGAPNIQQWEAALRARLEAVDGVIQVSEIETQLQSGILSYRAVIVTEYGSGAING